MGEVMKSDFNENFYIVAATIIPVFYLALVVQFQWLRRASWRLSREAERFQPARDDDENGLGLRGALRYLAISVVFIAGLLILTLGIRGEVNSVLALYRQADSSDDRQVTLAAIFVLIGAAGALPAWSMLLIFLSLLNVLSPLPKLAKLREWWYGMPEVPSHSTEEATAESIDKSDGTECQAPD
jgi:hypothetical protein